MPARAFLIGEVPFRVRKNRLRLPVTLSMRGKERKGEGERGEG